MHLVADEGVGLVGGRQVGGIVLLDEAEGGEPGHDVGVQGAQVVG